MKLGCIADDFTGATDLGNSLVRGGLRTAQTIGIPATPIGADLDAIVVALKSRTIPAQDAVRQSLAALEWLQQCGCERYYFKYCSTFDSTPRGNIGPVTDALMERLGVDFTIACPAFPENGRSIYRGYLFVGDLLLSESGMQHHPLTPMTDANLVRVLGQQTRHKVGLIRYDTVQAGAAAVNERIAQLRSEGVGIAIVDAMSPGDLECIAEACTDLKLVTAGSGLAAGMARRFRLRGYTKGSTSADAWPAVGGYAAVVSGSCSVATNDQVAHWLRERPGYRIDPIRLAAGEAVVREALAWIRQRLATGPVLVYATATPEEVKRVQTQLGVEAAGNLVEQALASVAEGLVEMGVRRLVVAGGETAGAVVSRLGVRVLRIGPEIDPGVPWTLSLGGTPLALALKSGNFGGVDFFSKALEQLP